LNPSRPPTRGGIKILFTNIAVRIGVGQEAGAVAEGAAGGRTHTDIATTVSTGERRLATDATGWSGDIIGTTVYADSVGAACTTKKVFISSPLKALPVYLATPFLFAFAFGNLLRVVPRFANQEKLVKYFIVAMTLFAALSLACAGERPANVADKSTVIVATPATTPLASATLDELASGRRIYEASCAGCHKDDGSGGRMDIDGKKINPEDLTEDKFRKMSDEKILGYIMNGVEDEGMPAFKGRLSAGEMRDVVKYIRTQIQKMPTAASVPKS